MGAGASRAINERQGHFEVLFRPAVRDGVWRLRCSFDGGLRDNHGGAAWHIAFGAEGFEFRDWIRCGKYHTDTTAAQEELRAACSLVEFLTGLAAHAKAEGLAAGLNNYLSTGGPPGE